MQKGKGIEIIRTQQYGTRLLHKNMNQGTDIQSLTETIILKSLPAGDCRTRKGLSSLEFPNPTYKIHFFQDRQLPSLSQVDCGLFPLYQAAPKIYTMTLLPVLQHCTAYVYGDRPILVSWSWSTANIYRGFQMLHNRKVFGLDIQAGSLLPMVWFPGFAVFSVTLQQHRKCGSQTALHPPFSCLQDTCLSDSLLCTQKIQINLAAEAKISGWDKSVVQTAH